MYSNCELYLFLRNIYDYEEGIYDIIKDLVLFKFRSSQELKDAVNIWCGNREIGMKLYGHISLWNTSMITDMSELFIYKYYFNDDINDWDVSNVENMYGLFCKAKSFNQDISGWNTSKVEEMSYMFSGAESFKYDLSNWNTSSVEEMKNMFEICTILE